MQRWAAQILSHYEIGTQFEADIKHEAKDDMRSYLKWFCWIFSIFSFALDFTAYNHGLSYNAKKCEQTLSKHNTADTDAQCKQFSSPFGVMYTILMKSSNQSLPPLSAFSCPSEWLPLHIGD